MFGEKEARMTDHISAKQFHESEGVADWRVLCDGATAYFRTRSLAQSSRNCSAQGRCARLAGEDGTE